MSSATIAIYGCMGVILISIPRLLPSLFIVCSFIGMIRAFRVSTLIKCIDDTCTSYDERHVTNSAPLMPKINGNFSQLWVMVIMHARVECYLCHFLLFQNSSFFLNHKQKIHIHDIAFCLRCVLCVLLLFYYALLCRERRQKWEMKLVFHLLQFFSFSLSLQVMQNGREWMRNKCNRVLYRFIEQI